MNKYPSRLFSVALHLLLGLLLFSLITATQMISAQAPGEDCAVSFQRFAYEGPRDRAEAELLPDASWQVEIASPIKLPDGTTLSLRGIIFTRLAHEQPEIWFAASLNKTIVVDGLYTLAVYQPQSQHWEIISPIIENTGLRSFGIFPAKDGTIWGTTDWDVGSSYDKPDTAPVLARFNEATRRFELAKGSIEIPLVFGFNNLGTYVREGQDNSLWIFLESDQGLYRYDPVSATTEKKLSLSFDSYAPVLSPDGSIYFIKEFESLLRYDPITNETATVEMPNKEWPALSSMLFDRRGRLWLGAIAYRETDGSWHQIIANLTEVTDKLDVGDYNFAPPSLLMESSDGLLWYGKDFDSGSGIDGLAWYDPDTGTGCMMTNHAAYPAEDHQHVLWVVVDGVLYKRAVQS